ncbi:serine/threonine-protein kinase [Hyalangium rubrum]|uniref:Serine/threonine-protein kinase n=1 Tax=Hyalangium rubrum TaxID=3103134 RepID=A0ABU5HFF5_9BACT|nr:serine/threonine-protein kinase [Hyalangium sp. s54d21]MDY7231599.1 serine/threonine-protein kinase [Hyalangium sp. s54d21]
METTRPWLELNPASLPVETLVGPWRVKGWRGIGTYGAVYRVERVGGEAEGSFALKLALRSRDERFEREADLLARIQHPNVPRFQERGLWQHAAGAFPYLVMDWVEGVPLYTWAEEHNLTSRQTLRLLAQVARALEATHAVGAVHRDVKGDNVLVRPEDAKAFLTDFGVGDYRGAATITQTPLPPGTPVYRSPEAWAYEQLFARHPDAHYEAYTCDDLFALGITAYRLVTGRYPPPTDPSLPGSMVWKPRGPGPRSPRAINDRVIPALEAIIQRLVAVSPVERFKGSAQKAAEALEQAAESAGPEADVLLFNPEGDRSMSTTEKEEGVWVEPPRHHPQWQEPPAVRSAHGQEAPAQGAVLSRSPSVPASSWGVWHTLTALGLALILVSVRWQEHPPQNSAPPAVVDAEPVEESRDGGVTSLGDTALTAHVPPSGAPAPSRNLALEMPKEPFAGQRRPPCPKGMAAIRGGCWVELAARGKGCEEYAYEWQGSCYMPFFPPPREPTSDPR